MRVAGVVMLVIGALLTVAPLVVMALLLTGGSTARDPMIFALYGVLLLMGLGLLYAGYRTLTFKG